METKIDNTIPPLDTDIASSFVMKETGTLRIAVSNFDSGSLQYSLLNEAKQIFEEKYPRWTVDIEEEGKNILEGGVIYDDVEANERYYNDLPYRLNSEYGLDIIQMYNANHERLLRENLLEDLLPHINSFEDFSLDMLLPCVLMATNYDDSLYVIPTSFCVDYLIFLKNDFIKHHTYEDLPSPWDWETVLNFFMPTLKKAEVDYLFPMTPQILTNWIVTDYYPYIYDYDSKKYDFNNYVFKEILHSIKKIYNQGLLRDASFEGFYILNYENALLTKAFPYTNIIDYNSFEKQGHNLLFPLPAITGTDGLAIRVMDEYAISANANEKSAAVEFIKILLSDEVQNSTSIIH